MCYNRKNCSRSYCRHHSSFNSSHHLDINRCDENRVGFVDFDLIADQTPQILNSLDPILNPDLTDFEVLYFDTLADAEANTTAAIIANPYRVNTSDNPTIYARIHNR